MFYLLSKGSDGGFVSATRIILHGKATELVLLTAFQSVRGLGLAFVFCCCGGIRIIASCENIGICGGGGSAGGGASGIGGGTIGIGGIGHADGIGHAGGIGGIGCVGGAHCFMCVV